MKKRYVFLIVGIVLAAAVAIGVVVYTEAYKPLNKVFANLDASQVESIQVLYGIHAAALSEEEIALLIPNLNQIKLVGRGTQEWREYDGVTSKQFYILLKDGTEFYFAAGSPFYIIDRKNGYWADTQLSGAINRLYAEFVQNHFS